MISAANSTPPTLPYEMQEAISLLAIYQTRPDIYAQQRLGVRWWQRQIDVALALVQHKRVLVKASHSVGKTHLAGGLVNWFFDCFAPSITLTTAPTEQQVKDLLWKEVRVQRGGRKGLMPRAPRMQNTDDHFAAGYTARDAAAFQGRHEEFLMVVFDEALGVAAPFWDATKGMMTGGAGAYWLGIFNPTDTATRAYEETRSGNFHVMSISGLDHPNIAAELEGRPAPYPAAIRLQWVNECIKDWCTPISAGDRRATDLEWPPGSGQWYRPGPLFESRVMGRWPSTATSSVWSDSLWEACLVRQEVPDEPTELGCDVARFGDDYTSILGRRGPCGLHHETHNGWSTTQTAGQLKRLAKELAKPPGPAPNGVGEDPKEILIKVDDDGVGGGVTDNLEGWNVAPISGAGTPAQPEDYPNRRSELWFATAARADEGRVDLSRLSPEALKLLQRQVMAPTWKVDAQGRRVVEPKADTKKRIGRSPDDADGLNLCFAPPAHWFQDPSLRDFFLQRANS